MSFSLAFRVGADVTDAIKNIGALQSQTNKSLGEISSSFKTLQNVAVGALGIFGASKIVGAFDAAVDAAAEFEQDVNQLRIALDATGQATDRSIQGFVDYAAQIQATTKFSDNAVLSTATLIQGLGQLSGTELKTATKAALDLSQALGIDLNAAASLVGKAANGNIAAFSKYGIEVRKGATDAETFANALSLIQQRFGGASEKSVNTYSGAVAQLKNNFDDAVKTFGLAIIENKAVIGTINGLSQGFVKLTGFLTENKQAISGFITGARDVFQFIATVAVPSIVGLAAGFGTFSLVSTAAAGGFVAIGAAAGTAGIGLLAMANAAIAATAPLLPFIAAGAIVGGIVAFATRVLIVRDNFVSLGDAIKGVALEIGKFLTFGELSEKLGQDLDALKQKKIDLDAGDAFEKFDQLNAAAKEFRKNTEEATAARIADEKKARLQLEDESTKSLEKIRNELKNAGKTQFEVVTENFQTQTRAIKDGLALGTIAQDEANVLRISSQEKYQTEVQKIDKEITDFYKGEADKRAEADKKAAEDSTKARAKIGAFAAGLVGSVSQGASGVAGALAGVAGTLVDTVLPGLGGAAAQLLQFLAQGPEAVRAQIQGFVDNIPTVISAISESIPVVFDTLVERAPDLIQRLVELAPEIAIRTGLSLSAQMPFIATTLAINLALRSPQIAASFVTALISESGRFITSLADGVKEALSKLTGGLAGGGGGGILGAVANPVGAISKKFKFASGGEIPPGFPNDSFPAFLSSGENVLTQKTSDSLEKALNSGSGLSGGGEILNEIRRLTSLLERGQNVTVNSVFDGDVLARLIFNLNLRGARTT